MGHSSWAAQHVSEAAQSRHNDWIWAGLKASAPTKPIVSPFPTSTKLPTGRSQNSKWVRSAPASLARSGAPHRRPVIPHVVRQQAKPTLKPMMMHQGLVQVLQIKDCWKEAEFKANLVSAPQKRRRFKY